MAMTDWRRGIGASELVAVGEAGVGQASRAATRRRRCRDALGGEDGPARALELNRCGCIGSMCQPFKPFDIGQSHAAGRICGVDADRARSTGEPRARDVDAATRIDVAVANALQVHNRYLVVETDAGIEVIDQHALHERILYEQIREKVLAGALESQKLLVPEPVDLTATEAAAVLEHAELLAQLGVEVQPFGGETVLVSSYPAMLANLSPAEVLRDLVEKLLAGGRQPEARDLLDELLHMIACKAAVKFGDRLTAEEIDALLAQRHLAQDQHHCPHGRPTALVFTREDLDRQFKRI